MSKGFKDTDVTVVELLGNPSPEGNFTTRPLPPSPQTHSDYGKTRESS